MKRMNITGSEVGFLLDMDGLLINSEEVADRVFHELCSRNGGSFTREIRMATIGTESSYWSKYIVENSSLRISPELFKEEFFKDYRKRLDKQIALMPGAQKLLDWLEKKDYPKCLVTSAGEENTQKNLSLLGLSDYFEFRVTAEVSLNGKPHPGPFLLGAEMLNVKPNDCIVFEDSIAGTISGHRAGCRVVSVPTEFIDKKELKNADYILDSLEEAVQLLENLGY